MNQAAFNTPIRPCMDTDFHFCPRQARVVSLVTSHMRLQRFEDLSGWFPAWLCPLASHSTDLESLLLYTLSSSSVV